MSFGDRYWLALKRSSTDVDRNAAAVRVRDAIARVAGAVFVAVFVTVRCAVTRDPGQARDG